MAYWEFRDYVTTEQRSPLLEWYGMLDPEVQAAFDLLLKNLSETDDWDEPKSTRRKYKELNRQHEGLCELRFSVNNRKFRPLGILNRQTREFILLGGAEKFGHGATEPEGAFDSALRLKMQFEEGRGVTRDFHY